MACVLAYSQHCQATHAKTPRSHASSHAHIEYQPQSDGSMCWMQLHKRMRACTQINAAHRQLQVSHQTIGGPSWNKEEIMEPA